MNTHEKIPAYRRWIGHMYYRGFQFYEDDRGVHIIVGGTEHTFKNAQEAQAFIDKQLSKVVVLEQ